MNLLSHVTLPILRGPLARKRWLLATRINFFLGTYESQQTSLFTEAVGAGQVVYDIGAHVGYYTILASQLVGCGGRVFAFEPSPLNLPRLRKHVKLNGCDNTAIMDVAVSDRAGIGKFESRCGTGIGRLSHTGSLEVRLVSLDDLVAEDQLPAPDVMKIDVEGAEFAVLTGGRRTIASAKPQIFLSTHSQKMNEQCCGFLKDLGYTLRPIKDAAHETDSEFLATCSHE